MLRYGQCGERAIVIAVHYGVADGKDVRSDGKDYLIITKVRRKRSIVSLNKYEIEHSLGNFEILSANIGILTASSFIIINAHIKTHKISLTGTMLLGFLFFLNQVDETFSHIGVDVATEASAVLVCLYIHLSHLIVCELGFLLVLFTHNI